MPAMDQILPTLGIIGFVVFAIAVYIWHFSRSSALLMQWAHDNGFEILHHDYRYFNRGPFFWTSSKWQTVYHVKVSDRDGHIRTGWVRCGSFLLGVMSDRVEVRWEH